MAFSKPTLTPHYHILIESIFSTNTQKTIHSSLARSCLLEKISYALQKNARNDETELNYLSPGDVDTILVQNEWTHLPLHDIGFCVVSFLFSNALIHNLGIMTQYDDMKTLSALLVLCEGNAMVNGGLPLWSYDAPSVVSLNKLLNE